MFFHCKGLTPVSNEKQRVRAKITFRSQWCKACGICIAYCPKKVYEADKNGKPVVTDESKCILCKLCVDRCPDFALDVDPVAASTTGNLPLPSTPGAVQATDAALPANRS